MTIEISSRKSRTDKKSALIFKRRSAQGERRGQGGFGQNPTPQAVGNDIGKDAMRILGARVIEDATGRLNV